MSEAPRFLKATKAQTQDDVNAFYTRLTRHGAAQAPAVAEGSGSVSVVSERRSTALPTGQASSAPRVGGAAGEQQHQQQQQQRLNYGIAPDNVGFSLLKKAGWKVGTGLGASEQGRRAPIEPHLQKGNRGIGWSAQQTLVQSGTVQPSKKPKRDRQGSNQAAVSVDAAKAERPPTARRRVADIAERELQAEPFDAKVKRVRQVMQQEEEDRRGRDIQKYLMRAFNEPSSDVTADSNPLRRGNHRLTATNPLLD